MKKIKSGNEQRENIHWDTYHASKSSGIQRGKVINVVLSLFYEAAHSAAMILHGLNIVIIATNFLNPRQMTVVCFDQPLYAMDIS